MIDAYEEGENIVYATGVEARISELDRECLATDMADWQGSPEQEELQDLLSLRSQCYKEWGTATWHDGQSLSLVSDDYKGEYAEYMAGELYGEVTATPYWDADRWAEDYYRDWQKVTLGNTGYWGNGRP